uniref:Luc7-like protein 3 n=1 Tax=Globodera rostochiensis TaxID=31243 RepID=A0A914HMR5_GLORO
MASFNEQLKSFFCKSEEQLREASLTGMSAAKVTFIVATILIALMLVIALGLFLRNQQRKKRARERSKGRVIDSDGFAENLKTIATEERTTTSVIGEQQQFGTERVEQKYYPENQFFLLYAFFNFTETQSNYRNSRINPFKSCTLSKSRTGFLSEVTMTAKDQIAAMLNELMGPGRNEDKNLDLNFRDTDVCKFFLAGFCPHDEFVNTKADLGVCRYVHDENLRIAYRKSEHFGKLGYERQFYYFLRRIHDDMMRRIERNKERLALTQGAQNMDEATKKQLEEKAERLEREMGEFVEVAERAGSRGDLEKSQKYVKRAEEVNAELDNVRKLLDPEARQHEVYQAGYKDPNAPKPMRVCEVCGSFLIIGDVQQRIDDHMQGRQHLGYAKITATLAELKVKLRDEITPERTSSRSPVSTSGGGHQRSHRRSRSKSNERKSRRKRSRSGSSRAGGGGGHRRAKRSHSRHRDDVNNKHSAEVASEKSLPAAQHGQQQSSSIGTVQVPYSRRVSGRAAPTVPPHTSHNPDFLAIKSERVFHSYPTLMSRSMNE